jgi:hypothetical protein
MPGSVPALVDAGLSRIAFAIGVLLDTDPRDPRAYAARAHRLAVLFERRARWWAVLQRHTFTGSCTVPMIYGTAVIAARRTATDDARFWAETANDWWARAERRPTSDAAGALSNWAELGVA